MKTQRKPKPDEQSQIINKKVEKAYSTVVNSAIDLLRDFEPVEFRTYCEMEHTKNELNANLIKEFLCFFWNITLSKSTKDSRYYIVIDLGKEALEKLGSCLTNLLLLKIYSAMRSNEETTCTLYALKINFLPLELLSYFHSNIAHGETSYISITTVEKIMTLKHNN